MKNLTLNETMFVSGGVNNNGSTHVEVIAINAGYVHVIVDTYQQPASAPTFINNNNIYVGK